MNNDRALLQEYAHKGDEAAFARLVESHSRLVYGTALRRLNGDTGMAQDVAQQVFIDLARKARDLPANVIIAGWLHQHACFLTSNALRSRSRRINREKEAHAMDSTPLDTPRPEEDLKPELDAALAELPGRDRDILILRFLHQQDLHAVGMALGLSEDAAQKRVARALDKLRGIFQRRGHAVSATGLVTVLAGAALSIATPPALAGTLTQAALASAAGLGSGTGTAHGSVGIWETLFMKNTKLALAGLLLVGIVIPLALQQRIRALETERELSQSASRPKYSLNRSANQSGAIPAARLGENSSPAMPAGGTASIEPGTPRIRRQSAPRVHDAAGNAADLPGTTNTAATNQWFTMEGSLAVAPGETVITGGWELEPGKRFFAFVTPSLAANGSVLIESRLLGVEPAAAHAVGLDGLITDQASAERYGVTNTEETKQLLEQLKNGTGFEMLSTPRVITGSGFEAEIQVGNEIRLRFTPRIAANGSDITLEMKGALKGPAAK